jgi:hypothetical protein
LSNGQLQYRLTKSKQAAGLEHGDGFRKMWREGRSQYERVIPAMLERVKGDLEKTLNQAVEKVAPKTVPEEQDKAA